MERRRAQFRLAIQVAGFRRVYLLNGSIFFHFIKHSADDTVLLIVDGHYSHTKNLDVVYKAREHSVTIVSLHNILSTKCSRLVLVLRSH